MDLNQNNSVTNLHRKKDTRKLRDLPVNIAIPILSMKIIKTQFGKAALAELPEKFVFLSKRALSVVEENIDNFKGGKYSIIYRGQVECNKPNPAASFDIIETKTRINNILKSSNSLKVNTIFCAEFVIKKQDDESTEIKYFHTKNSVIDRGTNLFDWFQQNVVDRLQNKLEEFAERGSGGALNKIIGLEVNVNKYEIGLVAALHPVEKDPQRVSKYPHYSTVLDLSGLEFPLKLKHINVFESNNNISVNVFGLEMTKKSNYTVVPLRLTKSKLDKHVNLLLIQNIYSPIDDENDAQGDVEILYHYCLIKNLSRQHNDCKISFSNEKFIYFKNFVNKEPLPFIIYADFESLLEPFNEKQDLTKKTSRYQKHVAYSVGYYFKCRYDNSISYYSSYTGLDCIQWFADAMDNVSQFVNSILTNVQLINVEIDIRDASPNCHICEKVFNPKDKIVRDHDHITGYFRGFAHSDCNLNYKNSFVVPVIFQNLSGYDAHFLIRELVKRSRITVLPVNKEKYFSFTKYCEETNVKFRFVDSYRFMGFSLDALSSILIEEDFVNLRNDFHDLEDTKFKLLLRKGVFCYDYVDNTNKLQETQLPRQEDFYSILTDEGISLEDYEYAQNVWRTFCCRNLGEYADLYLKTDVMLLTDLFEQFRATCHETYGLDPAHYYTIPGYTWDAMLKHTKCSLETIQDVYILLFFESGVRGGLSQCSNRYSVANIKYVSGYNSEASSKYLMYFDVNNLYGWAMSQYLSFRFEWLTDLEDFNVFNVADNSDIGYILEVDLYYPEHLHDLHRDLPFCPEHRKPPNSKLPKLMATLYSKQNCIIHYRYLKQCLKHVFNKPLYIAKAILDISKTCVYEFHYMLNKFDINACKLLYTDTDSFIYEIKCEDAYQEVIGNERMSTDENAGRPMTHFIGLRSKQYTFQVQKTERETKCFKKAKGIKSNVVKNKITFDDYLDCLKTKVSKYETQRTIVSHTILDETNQNCFKFA
ncbi:hypothetical protein NQ315_014650 [Exocentrus adspersus]|uniref:DNA-directed DNA polymerase n=1 Tax=Exocentrus adspersus TaxID=1586481 RepID=A0AAV8VR14_9CUCU|nr:hypothetical protein NQ315_014650 [Exocentrus adspersus]